MKKKLISIVAAVFVAAALAVPVTTDTASAKTVTVTPRTALPSYTSSIGKKWYYTNDNIFYRYDYGPNLKYLKSRRGYCRGNCTWYAYGRASEITGELLNPAFCRSAYKWYSINKAGKYYPYGSKPKVGAIACYSNHVAVVEKIENGKVYVSESGWKIGAKPTTASKIYFHYGTPWYSKATGYIYVCDGQSATTTAPTYTTTAANYRVKITAKDLNMRIGPGTSYESKGYVKAGTYTINAVSGGWGRLSSNGYWVSLSYTTKINDSTSSSSSTGATTTSASSTTKATTTKATTTKATTTKATTTGIAYKIKITIKDLNMRTGPGTSYKSKGHIKPGTYSVTQEKNGWAKISTNGYWVSLSYAKKIAVTTQTTTKATTTKSTTKATTTKSTTTKSTTKSTTTKGTTTKSTTKKPTTKAATTKKATSATSATTAKFKVKVTASSLIMRAGAGTDHKKKGSLKNGKVCTITKVKNGWGQLTNGSWIKLSYTKLKGNAEVKITASDLNMRTGAGAKYKSKGHVKAGTHKIKAMKDGWVQLASNGYWVNIAYVKFI